MTAIRLREQQANATIVLLEAERVGFGASGRNAGFLSPLAAPVWLLGAERSPDQAWAAARINRAVHEVARWLGEHALDCELAPARLSLQAESRLSDSALREFADAVALAGLPHEVADSRARPGHRFLAMDAYTMHPYKLVQGLAEHAARTMHVHERARVRAVERAPAGARLRLDDGQRIDARKVIVCTNAYTPGIELDERVRGFVVHSFMTATSRLEPAVLDAIVRDGDFTVEVNTSQAYYRVHDGRIIYGGIDKMREPKGGDFAVPGDVRARLVRHMQASFPGVELPIDEAWSGKFQTTSTGLPIIRPCTNNPAVVLNVAYGGTGVALSLACARIAAAVATGDFASADDERLLAIIHATRISVLDGVRTIARVARGFAQPWR